MRLLAFVAAAAVVVRHDDRAAPPPAAWNGTTPQDLLRRSPAAWNGTTPQDLFQEYEEIFRSHNRNAASHLWFAFLLQHAAGMPRARFEELSGGFCAVSGSPVMPSTATRYRLTLPRADGAGRVSGSMYYCCWPCVCDSQDFIRVDTLTVTTLEGAKEYNVAVIGNPCSQPERLQDGFSNGFGGRATLEQVAPELRCDPRGELLGLCRDAPCSARDRAPKSDGGHVVLGLFFRPDEPPYAIDGHTEEEYAAMCAERAANGYNSGMGEIFRRVASITPVGPRALVNGTVSADPNASAARPRRLRK